MDYEKCTEELLIQLEIAIECLRHASQTELSVLWRGIDRHAHGWAMWLDEKCVVRHLKCDTGWSYGLDDT